MQRLSKLMQRWRLGILLLLCCRLFLAAPLLAQSEGKTVTVTAENLAAAVAAAVGMGSKVGVAGTAVAVTIVCSEVACAVGEAGAGNVGGGGIGAAGSIIAVSLVMSTKLLDDSGTNEVG